MRFTKGEESTGLYTPVLCNTACTHEEAGFDANIRFLEIVDRLVAVGGNLLRVEPCKPEKSRQHRLFCDILELVWQVFSSVAMKVCRNNDTEKAVE